MAQYVLYTAEQCTSTTRANEGRCCSAAACEDLPIIQFAPPPPPPPKMTITDRVQGAFFDQESDSNDAKLIRLAPNAPPSKGPTRRQGRPWTNEEHDKFLQAMEIYPSGPWKDIAEFVGTRTTRQTMTHAQKYRQKIERWKRGASIKPLATAMMTPPASPQATEEVDASVDDALEDAAFWQVLQGILEKADDDDQSMLSLLYGSQPLQFVSSPTQAEYFPYSVDPVYEEFTALV